MRHHKTEIGQKANPECSPARRKKSLSLRFQKIYMEMSGLQNNQPHKKRMNLQKLNALKTGGW
jgi:hypothetical protein